jgi:hypothetical protein
MTSCEEAARGNKRDYLEASKLFSINYINYANHEMKQVLALSMELPFKT